jgi:hypothetical protein
MNAQNTWHQLINHQHTIICPDDNLEIPLSLQGVTSHFITRTPTIHEIETCKWIHLTDELFWDPHSEAFMEEEQKYDDMQEYIQPIDAWQIFCATSNQTFKFDTEMINLSSAFNDRHILKVCSTSTSVRHNATSAESLAQTWKISLPNAQKTIKCTTPKGVQNPLYPIE